MGKSIEDWSIIAILLALAAFSILLAIPFVTAVDTTWQLDYQGEAVHTNGSNISNSNLTIVIKNFEDNSTQHNETFYSAITATPGGRTGWDLSLGIFEDLTLGYNNEYYWETFINNESTGQQYFRSPVGLIEEEDLTPEVAFTNKSQTFSGTNTFSGDTTIGGSSQIDFKGTTAKPLQFYTDGSKVINMCKLFGVYSGFCIDTSYFFFGESNLGTFMLFDTVLNNIAFSATSISFTGSSSFFSPTFMESTLAVVGKSHHYGDIFTPQIDADYVNTTLTRTKDLNITGSVGGTPVVYIYTRPGTFSAQSNIKIGDNYVGWVEYGFTAFRDGSITGHGATFDVNSISAGAWVNSTIKINWNDVHGPQMKHLFADGTGRQKQFATYERGLYPFKAGDTLTGRIYFSGTANLDTWTGTVELTYD